MLMTHPGGATINTFGGLGCVRCYDIEAPKTIRGNGLCKLKDFKAARNITGKVKVIM